MPTLPAALRMLVISALAVGCAATTEAPADQSADSLVTAAAIPNFVTVRPGLYRGGRPTDDGLDELLRLGVKRIVNLEVTDFIEAMPWDIGHELDAAKAHGMSELRYPMSALEPAVSKRFDDNMNELVALLKTATPADPIFVHCKHGQDRTGLVIALERVIDENWAPADARTEMLKLGFHTKFAGLNHYFEKKTGFED